MSNNETKKNDYNTTYRQIEAMYRKGYNSDEIARSMKMSKIDVLDYVQKIFAMDMRKRQRRNIVD